MKNQIFDWSRKYTEKFGIALKMYDQGISIEEICKTLSMDKIVFRKNLMAFGRQIPNKNANDKIFHNVFEEINTEEKAYWLGFLYADGNVSKDDNRISLCIKDLEHMEKFAKFIGKDIRIKTKIVKNKPYFLVFFRSEKMKNDLINKGCIPQKSLILKFPEKEILPENLQIPFIRGYFDGDGCISKIKEGRTIISLIGTFDFLEKVKKICSFPERKYARAGKAF